jgi:hypothetical protein
VDEAVQNMNYASTPTRKRHAFQPATDLGLPTAFVTTRLSRTGDVGSLFNEVGPRLSKDGRDEIASYVVAEVPIPLVAHAVSPASSPRIQTT